MKQFSLIAMVVACLTGSALAADAAASNPTISVSPTETVKTATNGANLEKLVIRQSALRAALKSERQLASVRSDRYKRLQRELSNVDTVIAQLEGNTSKRDVADSQK